MARTPGPRRLQSSALLLSALSAQPISFPKTKVCHLPTCCQALLPHHPQTLRSPPRPKAKPTASGHAAQRRGWGQPSGQGLPVSSSQLGKQPCAFGRPHDFFPSASPVFLTLPMYSLVLNPPPLPLPPPPLKTWNFQVEHLGMAILGDHCFRPTLCCRSSSPA